MKCKRNYYTGKIILYDSLLSSSMPINYNRLFRLSVYYAGDLYFEFESKNQSYNIQFNANIVRDGFGSGTSRSTIDVFNLNQSKRNTLQTLIAQQDATFQVQIDTTIRSQQNAYQTIVYDDAIGVYNELAETGDYKTQFILSSGENIALQTYHSVSYPAGTKLSTILQDECSTLRDNYSIKSYAISSQLNDTTFAMGWSRSGNTFDELKKLCFQTGNAIVIDRGQLMVIPVGAISSSANTIMLNSSNGLLEYPHLGQTSFSKKYQEDYDVLAFQFKALLIPFLQINDLVTINRTTYTVKRFTHSISTQQGEAWSLIEGVKSI